MLTLQRDLNALLIFILCAVLTSAFGVQFLYHEEPCPLCLLQRLGMISVAAGAALNLYFGVRMSHYGLILLSSLFGGIVALRQISLHVCPGFSKFGFPVLGFSLYTWSFIVFACVVFYTALLLFFYDPQKTETPPQNLWTKSAYLFLFLVVLANIVTTFFQCGFGPCE